MSKLTQSYTVCDWCGGAIPVGNDHIHNVGGVLSIDQTEQSFTGMDFCSADHVAAWISALPAEVPLPDPLYPAPPGAPPTVTSIFPASGNFAGGDTVTLIGTGFTSAIGVTFGSIPATAVFVAADTALTCVSPQQPVPPNRPLPVVVTTPSGTSTQPIQFAYAEPPPPPPGIDVPTGSLMLEGSLVEVNTPPTTPTPPPPLRHLKLDSGRVSRSSVVLTVHEPPWLETLLPVLGHEDMASISSSTNMNSQLFDMGVCLRRVQSDDM